jgi:NAD(P)H dehydrogenase (quinone)
LILVTGAAGKTGRAIIQALSARGAVMRALVHHPEQAHMVKVMGAQEAVVGDMRIPATMERATQGVRGVYHICPNLSPDEALIGQTLIAAARAAGVQHLVYHSVLHPQVEAMPHHWLKLRVEELLFESGLPCTILQPTAYMQNVLAHWDAITTQGLYPVPYALETRLSLVDLQDVAQVAATVLTAAGHVGATYELVGTGAMDQTQVAGILGQQLGRPVRAQVVPIETWEQGARASGLGDYQVETLRKMFRYYERYGFEGNPRVLGWLLGRPPTTLAAFVERIAQEHLGR